MAAGKFLREKAFNDETSHIHEMSGSGPATSILTDPDATSSIRYTQLVDLTNLKNT